MQEREADIQRRVAALFAEADRKRKDAEQEAELRKMVTRVAAWCRFAPRAWAQPGFHGIMYPMPFGRWPSAGRRRPKERR
jgi:hypothetical protein